MNKIILSNWRVYGLTNNFKFAKELIQAKVKVIQYRNKNIDDSSFIQIAQKIAQLCRKNKVIFIINDRYQLNHKIKADGVHIGLNDDSFDKVRKFIGKEKIIGLSIKTVEQALAAQIKGIDYISVSPVFNTINKIEEKGVGLERLKQVSQAVNIPVVAIGGITEQNLPSVVKAGADSAAFIGELVNAENLTEKVKNLQQIYES